MEVRNSAGHRVSLLNDEAASTTSSSPIHLSSASRSKSTLDHTKNSGANSIRLPPIVDLPHFTRTSSCPSVHRAHSHTQPTAPTIIAHRPRLNVLQQYALSSSSTTTQSSSLQSYTSARSYDSSSSSSSSNSSRRSAASSNSPPDTPPLERSDSADSAVTMNMDRASLSPPTPTYNDPYTDVTMMATAGLDQHGKPLVPLAGDAARGPYFGVPGVSPFGVGSVAPMGEWYSDVAPLSPPNAYTNQAPYAQMQPNPDMQPGLTGAVVPPPYTQAQQLQAQQAQAQAAAQAYHLQQAQALAAGYQAPSLTSPTTATAQTGTGTQSSPDRRSSTTKIKNNKFACPLAREYNCTDTFTTSGHAARHAKKHTGKKDAICPECSKAFTRKDNMEQHRRTHKNGKDRSSARGSDASSTEPTERSTTTPSHARKASTVSAAARSAASSISGASPRVQRRPQLPIDTNAILANEQALHSAHSAGYPHLDPALPISPTAFSGMANQYPLPPFDARALPGSGSSYPDPSPFALNSPVMVGVVDGYGGLQGSGGLQAPLQGSEVMSGMDALSAAAERASNHSDE